LDAMNFPGLDPLWSGLHHAGRSLGLIRPWPIEETRARLADGEKVLVVATTALGDSLLTTPLLETLSHHLGPARVSLLVREPYVDLYRDDPRVHRVFSVRGKYRWNHLQRELKSDPHRIALLANITEPDLVPCLWRGGVRGFLRYASRWTRYSDWMANRTMLRRPGENEYATGHAIENNLAMAEALGLEPVTHRLALPHLETKGAPCRRMILIHPGASRAIKRWPAENWARLADALAVQFQADISFTGNQGERPLAEEIIGRMKSSASNRAGTLSLPALAQAQAEAAAFLSGDTGPYHLALAVGCPTVTLFAPTDRGSSIEACGPHRVDPVFHRALQTANFGDPISTISFEQMLHEATAVVGESLARSAS
jgi:ADP-heptose:LPS heptosyltransferase